MTPQEAPPAAHPFSLRRILGRHGDPAAGARLIVIAGLHGNEPAGVMALERVLRRLRDDEIPLSGEIVAITGNLQALDAGERYLRWDLNRAWSRERVAALRVDQGSAAEDAEQKEQRELLATLDGLLLERGEVFVLDLHTTSASGPPFTIIEDTLRNRSFARRFPVPLVLGLEEQIDGALLDFLTSAGLVTLGFEGGQHDDPLAVDCLEAAVWLALEGAGCLADLRIAAGARTRLSETAKGLPRVVEIIHRHAVTEEDGFRMEPGFAGFDRVSRGALLGRDRRGPVRARAQSRVLLPLYQGLGNDGFFLARRVRPFWLALSAWLRHRNLEWILPQLPGVHCDPEHPGTLIIETRIARWFALELAHLFGFRKERERGGVLHVSRRKETSPPDGRG